MPGLEDLYREIILDHYRNPQKPGRAAHAPGLCGDRFQSRCAGTR